MTKFGLVFIASLAASGFVYGSGSQAETQIRHAYAPYSTPVHGPDFKHFRPANPEAPKACTLRLSADGAFNTLNPWITKGRFANGIYRWHYDSLLTLSPDEKQVGYTLIAESVEVSTDGREAVFRIRPQARFHDGEPILADDVVYTSEVFRETARPFWRVLLKDARVEALDDRTVRVRFPEGAERSAALHFGTVPVIPKHYWQDRDFGKTTMEPPLGSGPYRIAEVDPGRRIVFERVRDYWAKDLPVRVGAYNFDRIVHDHFFDRTTRLTSFLKGEGDRYRIDEREWIESQDKPAVRDGKVGILRLDAWWPMGMNGFFFNLRDGRFADVRVREALGKVMPFNWVNAHLLHKAQSRTQSYFENAAFAATSPPTQEERAQMAAFPGHFPAQAYEAAYRPHDANLPRGERESLTKALGLLREAGWRIDPDTGLQTRIRDGRVLDFAVLAASDRQEKLFGAWARQLERLGVRARLQVVDSAAYEARLADRDFEIAYRFYIPMERPGAEQIRLWGSAALNPEKNGNRFGIASLAVDHFLTRLRDAEGEAERHLALRLLDRSLQWGHYAVPSYQDRQWRFAYWRERLMPPETKPAQGDGRQFWWCRTPEQDVAESGIAPGKEE